MIIEIDGYGHNVRLSGKKCSERQLREMYRQTKTMVVDIKDFPDVFCRLHRFDRIQYSNDMNIDFVLDTDTDHIYTPS
ncbi:hypothetical protein [Exiguobacterium sp. SH0S2]|uniref:hypothetical protein n=1 Tax=Exiguobacterium sp. SH0S2 TaxID=2510950 RepID=UPI00103F9B84|nr:hypothetical protein [Exiguobacterium sp. SH0S2]TCI61680.1 hypothetical protein EVJ21_10515 [Exiguobacterium sp. SH0S2]